MPFIPLGDSECILNGETVVVAGNPGGRGTVFTSGIVSSRRVLGGGQNALVMTNYNTKYYDTFIQFDAASNRGNSGGPLINMNGELIGIVSALVLNEQNAGLAIPTDLVWHRFDDVMEAELMRGTTTGIKLKQTPGPATVAAMESPTVSAQHDLQSGDVIVSVNGRPVRHSVDWHLVLLVEARPNRPLKITVKRGESLHDVEMTLPVQAAIASIDRDETEAGLKYELYHGLFDVVPDFTKLEPASSGVVPTVDLDKMRGDRDDEFAIAASGCLQIPSDGIYRLIIYSDDGSRVLLHDKLVIDNDGNHPPREASKRLRLKSGLHPIRIEHFERNGLQSLQLFLESPDGKRIEVSRDMFVH